MSWWEQLNNSHIFLLNRQEALKQRPDFTPTIRTKPAAHIISAQVLFPLTLTIDEYAAFLTISSKYLDGNEEGAPIDCYMLGSTVLMWHYSIWEYIGQAVNLFCDRFSEERVVTFNLATGSKTLRQLPAARLAPMTKVLMTKLTTELRSICGSAYGARMIRGISTHRYHIANTYTPELTDLLHERSGSFHHSRLSGLRTKVVQSFTSLMKASKALVQFVDNPSVQEWHPDWWLS